MPADGPFCFEPYRLEVRNARLWRGSQELHLTAKALSVPPGAACRAVGDQRRFIRRGLAGDAGE